VSWLGTEKVNLTQQKHTFTIQKKWTSTQNKHKKVKPGLVASYDILAWKWKGPILVSAIHKFVTYCTYFDIYPLTAPGLKWGYHSRSFTGTRQAQPTVTVSKY